MSMELWTPTILPVRALNKLARPAHLLRHRPPTVVPFDDGSDEDDLVVVVGVLDDDAAVLVDWSVPV